MDTNNKVKIKRLTFCEKPKNCSQAYCYSISNGHANKLLLAG